MYGYEIWFDCCCIHEDEGFESYEDAEEDANEMILDYIEEWEMDEDAISEFEIIVKEEW